MPAALRSKPPRNKTALPARGETGDRTPLIDAAERCYARLGIGAATMADIALEAGISRRTLYRQFASHEQILNAVVRRAIDRFWQQFHDAHSGIDDFCDYLVEALIYTLKYAPKTKTHRMLFDQAMLPLVNKIYIDNRDYLRDQARALDAVYQRTRHRAGTRQDLNMQMVCEWFNRLAVSFLATPSAFYRSETELRALLSAMLAPALRHDPAARPGAPARKGRAPAKKKAAKSKARAK